jgi:hypothetical protein
LRPLLSTGAVVRYPEYPEHWRLLEHELRRELELGINPGWDERVVDDLAGLPIVTAHAEKPIGATLSTDEPALDPLLGRLAHRERPPGLRTRRPLPASAVREDGTIDVERLEKCVAWLRTLAG